MCISQLGRVAQWTRARGYEPRCQGFDSLLDQFLDINQVLLSLNNYLIN